MPRLPRQSAYAAGVLVVVALAGCGQATGAESRPVSVTTPVVSATTPFVSATVTTSPVPRLETASPSAIGSPPEALTRRAFEVAKASADEPKGAASAEAVATTRGKALVATGGSAGDNDGAVWLFAFTGQFHSNGSRPQGASAPTGTHLYLLMDGVAGGMTDLVLTQTAAQLGGLGGSVHVIAP